MITNSQLFSVLSRFISSMSWFCGANQWTGFYMITASGMKELNDNQRTMLLREAKFLLFDLQIKKDDDIKKIFALF